MAPRRDRPLLDTTLVLVLGTLRLGARLAPQGVVRGACRVACAVAVTLTWPLLPVRGRAAAAGVLLPPWRWGASLGSNLASLLGSPPPLQTLDVPDTPAPALVLAAH
ncbi:MAG: hypothetical protein KDA24_14430, partial [Deltaproteobacteria bacterium]|nr:hypothetical protein [Deltaproteobacteria bacterium]